MANKVHSRVQLENRVVINHSIVGVCEWASGSPPPPLFPIRAIRCQGRTNDVWSVLRESQYRVLSI